ncbi:hypothetical protein CK203_013760 [Vitis vinifera]|uniref:Uncharacterized protein n=1 Tax=Vitis vinifera TaxID=29760 RepID=A0A438JJR7_VITVI|nr:hypothetical protein CK203_013760 [Vitis vinifera]
MEHKYVALDKHKRSGIVHLKFAPFGSPIMEEVCNGCAMMNRIHIGDAVAVGEISIMWIYHHYCAMIMALVSLTWEIKGQPNCAQKQRGVQLFLQWAMMQGVAMLLQNRYQRQRLYTRIALGKVSFHNYYHAFKSLCMPSLASLGMVILCLDFLGGKGDGGKENGCCLGRNSWGRWSIMAVVSHTFILQGFEAYVGLLLLKTAFVGVVSEWQKLIFFAGGILRGPLVLMAVGNFANTVQTLMVKSRFKAKMKRSKSKQELN